MTMLDPKTLRQAVCPVCKLEAPLNSDDTIGNHDPYRGSGFTTSLRCDGIGQRGDKLKRAS